MLSQLYCQAIYITDVHILPVLRMVAFLKVLVK